MQLYLVSVDACTPPLLVFLLKLKGFRLISSYWDALRRLDSVQIQLELLHSHHHRGEAGTQAPRQGFITHLCWFHET